jgi:exopolyphosphatase/guanosine-5'-triphosphate,3'-diphosphate pyrophosphatase
VTTVAAIAHGLAMYDPDQLHHSRLSRADAELVTEQLLTMTRAQRRALAVMHPGRVDVIGAGALILTTVMQQVGLDEVLVSETDLLDGIALSIR